MKGHPYQMWGVVPKGSRSVEKICAFGLAQITLFSDEESAYQAQLSVVDPSLFEVVSVIPYIGDEI